MRLRPEGFAGASRALSRALSCDYQLYAQQAAESGRTLIDQGMLDTANRHMEARDHAYPLTPKEIAEIDKSVEESWQEFMSRTEDREDDRIYEEYGAGALAMLRMSRDTPTPKPPYKTRPAQKN